jgi:polyisoprenoid-binding protein YceI/rhodanese-related sulfurtransferase
MLSAPTVTTITRDELQARLDAGVPTTIVEALPPMYYADAHLPGALNLPHDEVAERAAALLPDRDAAIVVYCSNTACQNSSIAARRLANLGYTNVLAYVEGKQDWIEAGLPVEHGLPATAKAPATRVVGGIEVPAAGDWAIDPGHADVAFIGRHFMLTKVRGRFTDVEGVVRIGEDPADSSVAVTIGMASVTSGAGDRDAHLRSPDFFDVERFPTATFTSTHVRWDGRRAAVTGDLTIVGVTRPVVLDVEHLGTVADTTGGHRSVFSASTEIDREDWGLTWNVALEAGGILVSKRIRIEIEVETVRV